MNKEYKHSLSAKILGGAIGFLPGTAIGFFGSECLGIDSRITQIFLSSVGAVFGGVIGASRGNELYNDIMDHIDHSHNQISLIGEDHSI